MSKFSDRQGITNPPKELQLKSMNEDLRNTFWNFIAFFVEINVGKRNWYNFLNTLYFRYFKLPITLLPHDEYPCRDTLFDKFKELEWFEVYNIMEIIMEVLPDYIKDSNVKYDVLLNGLMEKEFSGYRIINGEFTPITSQDELNSIRNALTNTAIQSLQGANEHLSKSITLLSKKPVPDYRNSIKESISGVESTCKILSGVKTGGIKGSLKALTQKIYLHPAMHQSLLNLYGYTSNEDGVRHAILEEKEIGFAEAKFMLVNCTAFINYIIEKAFLKKLT